MKTTVDIPDALLIRAKKRAVELRRPLRELVIEGLKARLGVKTAPLSSPKQRSIRWVVVQGGVPPNIDLSDRTSMQKLFQK